MSIFIIFAIFFGLDWLATVPPTMRLISDYFQGKEAIIFGWIFVGHQLGAAVAAWGTGWIRGAMHSYIPAFGISAILCFLSAFMILNLNMKMRSSIKI